MKQLDAYFMSDCDIDIEPTTNEHFYATSEEELTALVSRWVSDFTAFQGSTYKGLIANFYL